MRSVTVLGVGNFKRKAATACNNINVTVLWHMKKYKF